MPESIKHRDSYYPTHSLEERDRRWAAIRERMYQRGLDCLLIWSANRTGQMGRANLRYVTHVPGQVAAFCVFPVNGEPAVLSGRPQFYEPHSIYDTYQNWVQDTRLVDPNRHPMAVVAEEVESRGLADGHLGIVGYGGGVGMVGKNAGSFSSLSIPHGHFSVLTGLLPDAEFSVASDLVEHLRLIKSDEEIERLRKAGTIAREMADDFMAAEPGQPESRVYAEMARTHLLEGGEADNFIIMDSGSPTDDEVEHLLHGKNAPLAPSRRTLAQGDLLLTEYHANFGGYLAAVEKSVVLGDAPDELLDIHEVCLQCMQNGLDMFRPGTRLEDVWEAIRAPAHEAGMDFTELGFHGHGLASPEYPTVLQSQESTETYPDVIERANGRGLEDVRLREGMVFGTNIDVHDPTWRHDVGLMYGDTILVTEDGPEKLVNTPPGLVV